jgi:Fe-S-cluster formation regulator IscX/YfhJ
MSRKDFNLIAQAFYQTKPLADCDTNRSQQWWDDVRNVAYALRETNPRFDVSRFLAACGKE